MECSQQTCHSTCQSGVIGCDKGNMRVSILTLMRTPFLYSYRHSQFRQLSTDAVGTVDKHELYMRQKASKKTNQTRLALSEQVLESTSAFT